MLVANVSSWANYFALSWLPKYLHEKVGVSLDQTGFVLILPYFAPVVGGNLGAQIADRMLKRGWSVLSVRRTMECICATPQTVATYVCAGRNTTFVTHQLRNCLAQACFLTACLVLRCNFVGFVQTYTCANGDAACGSSILCLGYFAVEEQPSLMSFTVLTTIEGFFSAFSMSGYLTSKACFIASIQNICSSLLVPRLVFVHANQHFGGFIRNPGPRWRSQI